MRNDNFTECLTLAMSIQDLDVMDAPLDGNKCCDVIYFWSRSCIDNARVQHSVKSTFSLPSEFNV